MNAERFVFPAPGKAFYLLTLSAACLNCAAPAGVSIEIIAPKNTLYKEYKQGYFIDGDLEFEDWGDTSGVAIVTGMLREEFVKATSSHLVGICPKDFHMKDGEKIDANMAEVILEEMYEDSQVKPTLVEPKKKASKTTSTGVLTTPKRRP